VRYGRWYVAGNVMAGNRAVTRDNWNGGIQFKGGGTEEDPAYEGGETTQKLIAKVRAPAPFPMAPIAIQSAAKARQLVLAHAGATLPRRDAVDERAVRQTRTGQVDFAAGKGIITDVAQVGGYPEYRGTPWPDVGADGLPLAWKQKYKLDVADPALAQKDLQGDGYTVIEKYLAGLDPTKKIDWQNPASNVNTLP